MKYSLCSIFLVEYLIYIYSFYRQQHLLQEMVHSSESSMSWQTFMKTLSLNSDQLLARNTAVMTGSTSETSCGSLDSPTTALTKGIARHVIYGKIFN